VLTAFERFAVRVMRWANTARITAFWQRRVLVPVFGLIFDKRAVAYGLEHVPEDPQARILMVANHRTFFDLFCLGWILLVRKKLPQSVSFPVRANFFYENPLGLGICLILSGGSMYPPFFRHAEKKNVNRDMMDGLIAHLQEPSQIVGFHPEGTRSTTDNPYQLLPAKPGAGQLALRARPIVVPAFISGMGNSFWGELTSKKPIIAVFGPPIELPETEGELRLSHYKKVSDLFNERIAALGAQEKEIRAKLT
jgi:1-acyl-sn-glycerol-3-phosphate acyltransferase